MRHVVDVNAEGVRVPIGRARVAEIARTVLRAEKIAAARLSITFVDSRRIASLNRRHLGHHGATDVISFPLAAGARDAPVLGDIYIAPEVARRSARENHLPIREELIRLVVHGVLHVAGRVHPEGRGREASPMWRRQEDLVRSLVGGTRLSARVPRGAYSAA